MGLGNVRLGGITQPEVPSSHRSHCPLLNPQRRASLRADTEVYLKVFKAQFERPLLVYMDTYIHPT